MSVATTYALPERLNMSAVPWPAQCPMSFLSSFRTASFSFLTLGLVNSAHSEIQQDNWHHEKDQQCSW